MKLRKYDESSSKKSPWQRKERDPPAYGQVKRNTCYERFHDYNYDNMYLDIDSKRAVLRVATSVVGFTVFSNDGVAHRDTSGTVIECDEMNGTYLSTILTSASLIEGLDSLDTATIEVYFHDGSNCKGKIHIFDFHYNIATIQTKTDAPLTVATLVNVDDSLTLKQILNQSWEIRRHSEIFTICPGDSLIAVGRHMEYTHELMAAPGVFSVGCCQLDCTALLRANCKITKCGIGGPVINKEGQVLGISFFNGTCTPFLPMNLVSKILTHVKNNGIISRPWLGIEITNLSSVHIEILEKILLKFPDICSGVFVEKVVEGSPAFNAGIKCNDVIVKCGKKVLRSVVQLTELMYSNVSKPVKFVVLRGTSGEKLKLTMVAEETNLDNFNRWPLPQEYWMSTPGLW